MWLGKVSHPPSVAVLTFGVFVMTFCAMRSNRQRVGNPALFQQIDRTMTRMSTVVLTVQACFYLPITIAGRVTSPLREASESTAFLVHMLAATMYLNGTCNAIIFLVSNRKSRIWLRCRCCQQLKARDNRARPIPMVAIGGK